MNDTPNTSPKPPPKNSKKIKLGRWEFNLPNSRFGRIVIGVLLILGGFLWFLPVLGLWMMPLGFIILAQDFHFFRRFNRRISLWWGRRKTQKDKRDKK